MPQLPFDRLFRNPVAEMAVATIERFTDKGGPHLSAALTFFTLFSFAPLLIFVVAFAGLLLGQDTARTELVAQVDELMGPEVAEVVSSVVASTQRTTSGTIAVVFGLVTVAYGASRVFRGLQGGLNFIWDARPEPRNPILGLVIERFVSWGTAFVAGMSLATALAVFVLLTASTATRLGRFVNVSWLNDALGTVLGIVVVAAMFAAVYRFVPAVDIRWRDVVPAAAAVSVALFVGARLVGLVIDYAGPGSSYLVASVPTILLIWVNVSAQIVYVGAAFTYVYAHRYGSLRPRGGVAATAPSDASRGPDA